ncbi:hypothetical protein [Pseudonocardia sp. McavD-2-B]|uniref:hypothetical protein n=1 Tax=Pseudonocardia sp. McavD-2-B TaxID=2954499 RepID=UPI00209837D3|nr:hypothetical protein [Pseudonocardia sp. McavD-2-B]MCO7195640.1 hypothetical protein [Pseudonocardia sp. McavD-2-B]
MAWHDRFLLGPLGAMRELPSPPAGGGVDVTPERRGGVFEALGGSVVVDVWNVLRTWEFEWPERFPAEVDRVLRAWHGLDRRPRRLLDPMHGPNLLTLDTSTVGAASRTLATFVLGSRPVAFRPVVEPVADLDGVAGGLRWSVPENVADALRADVRRRVPALDRPVTVSMWARGAGTARAQAVPYGPDGQAGDPHVGAQTTLTGSWQRLTATAPAGSGESVVPGLHVDSGAPRNVDTVGWQAEHGTEASAWSPGGACPVVVLTGTDYGYRRLNRRVFTLTLREVA